MEVQYKREMNHNYMIIDAPSESVGYECQMLSENSIDGLLKFRIRYQEGQQHFYYEITSRQPLSRVLEKRKIKGEEIRRLMLDIISVMERIEEYLLKGEQLLLTPEFIYVDPDCFRVRLCLLPGYVKELPEALSGLLKFLLEKVDHQDRDGVVIAYNLYQESQKENYGLCDLVRHLLSENDTVFCREEARKTQSSKGGDREDRGKDNRKMDAEEIHEYAEEKEDMYMEKPYEMPENRRPLENKTDWIQPLLLLMAAEGIIWYLMGEAGIRSYGIWALAAILFLWLIKRTLGRKFFSHHVYGEESDEAGMKGEELGLKSAETEENRTDFCKTDYNGWEIYPESEEEYQERIQKREKELLELGREEGTALLRESVKPDYIAILEPLNQKEESIIIPYVPFIIGKHSELSDYVIKWPEISRLHLRIDKKENVCIVTDLNSTNGTSVNGYMLQANETVSIKRGDMLYLAGKGYKFLE